MDRRNLLKMLAGLAVCPACTTAGFAAEGAHWSYEGAGGPAKWGDLDAANKACSLGSQQSPINIGPTIKSQLPALKLSWGKTADTIVNNGHTIQLNFAEGRTLEARRHHLQIVAGALSPAERTSDRRQEFSDGGTFRASRRFRRARRGRRHVSEGKPNVTFGKIIATSRQSRSGGEGGCCHQPERAFAGEARLLPVSGFADDPAMFGSCRGRMAGVDRSDPGRGQSMSPVSQNSTR